LVRVYGMYKITHDKKDIYFMVMSNVFNTMLPIHENYDLKGSTKDRTSNNSEGSKKDSDFRRKLYLGAVAKATLLNQVNLDTEVNTTYLFLFIIIFYFFFFPHIR